VDNGQKQIAISVIIPACNEETRLAGTLNSYVSYLSERVGSDFQLIVVCNGCTDNTPRIAGEFSRKFAQIRGVNFPARIGKGGAIKEGFRMADGEIIAFVDADGAIKPDEVWKLTQMTLNGSDCAIGSRRAPGARILAGRSFMWQCASRGFNWLVRLLFWLPFSDTQCGVKVFKKRVVQSIINELGISGMTFDVELLWRARSRGYRVTELPIVWEHQPKSGPTNDLLRTVARMTVDIMKLRLGLSKAVT
jgi:glycosyltransferase involved in cell wall biosynthesis